MTKMILNKLFSNNTSPQHSTYYDVTPTPLKNTWQCLDVLLDTPCHGSPYLHEISKSNEMICLTSGQGSQEPGSLTPSLPSQPSTHISNRPKTQVHA